MEKKPLTGRIALITGASRGLGRAMAVALAQDGATLVAVARDEEALNETARLVREAGSEAAVYAADICDEAQVLDLEKKIRERFGKLHILINNAGINIRKRVTEFTLEEWSRMINTNLTSAFLMCRSFVPLIRGQGYGRIINMTSIMSHVSLPGRTLYSATKTGLLGFTRVLAQELASEGITVVGISPGPFATEMNTVLMQNPEINAQFMSRVPLNRWGRVEEVGALARFLCSDEAGYITGSDILIDGGWCSQ